MHMDDPDRLRYDSTYEGVVVDDKDPDGRHRVRIRIPGMVEQTTWARPLTAGGGSPQRGGHVNPLIGADVVVWFIGGDIERPVYMCGAWGTRPETNPFRATPDATPQTGLETPQAMKDAGANAHLVQSMDIGRLRITVDETPGASYAAIEDRVTGDGITFDFENVGITIKASAALRLQASALLVLEGGQITIDGRQVMAVPKAI
jgi:hypothetical protein